VELRDYVRLLRKGWIFIAVFTLLGIALGSLTSILQTPEYRAAAKVFVSVQSSGSVSDLSQGGTFAQAQVRSYADVATTARVLEPVIESLDLPVTSSQLASRISATSPQGTVILDISVTDESPQLAADIANEVASSLERTVSELVPSSDQSTPVKITLLQNAFVPTAPASPNTLVNILLGGAIGLILGVTAAVLRQVLDTRISNEHDVETLIPAPIVGGIVYDARTTENPLVVRDDPRSPRAESFRTLRTNLQFLGGGDGGRSFVMTSSIPGEGKSTTSSNLAIALAISGLRVLLVDADLRKPRQAEYLGVEGAVGLTDVLVGRAEPNDVVQRWGDTNLYVLPAGTIPPNPSELLGSKTMIKLITSLEGAFDVVLFDAPPLLPVTDAAILATHTGGALLMVAAGKVHKNQVKGAVMALQNVGAQVAGVVLTMLPAKGPDSYGYGRYGYGYGYGDELKSAPRGKRG
jgi:succinoglycan biosynthesis transport protein ExoP